MFERREVRGVLLAGEGAGARHKGLNVEYGGFEVKQPPQGMKEVVQGLRWKG